MEIKGKVHCFFEQSGTFKNEFIKLGIPAEDYDIQNNFNETDHVIDLFAEIEKAYGGGISAFDDITEDDLIIAFFPCIYFCQTSQFMQSLNAVNYRALTIPQAIQKIINRQEKRQYFLNLLTKLIYVCCNSKIRLIIENPITDSFLNHYFIKAPDVRDMNRMLRGDYYKKPTGYWYFNCKATYGESYQNDKKQRQILKTKSAKQAGLCSEERSMISPDYARNFICDFIIGKTQNLGQLKLFKEAI